MISPELEAARLSELAYAQCTRKFDNGIEVLEGWNNERKAVAFRGTEINSLGDILRDLRAVPWYSQELGCWCHSGFLKGVRKIWPYIQDLYRSNNEIVFTGHSKGAAEATIAAALALKAGYKVPALYTFGSPRCAFSDLSAVFAEKGTLILRFVHGDDCVPSHPWPVWGYKHLGDEIFLYGKGEPIGDHKMNGYRQALESKELV